MAFDLGREIRNAIKTGRVYFGLEQAKKTVKKGKAKLLIVAKNQPKELKEFIKDLNGIPVYSYPGTNVDLGALCGKPFPVSVITVEDAGTSNVLQIAEE